MLISAETPTPQLKEALLHPQDRPYATRIQVCGGTYH